RKTPSRRRLFMTRLLPLACVLLLCAAPFSFGAADGGKVTDQAKVAPAGQDTEPARKTHETLAELILAGGPLNIAFIGVLGLFSLLALAVILERLVNLRTAKLIPPDFVRGLQELIRRDEDQPKAFRELCD